MLEQVDNLSEDRVLRQYLALILATNRTNFWRRDAAGKRRSFLSFKFDPAKVPGLPEPKPMFEIFVYSTRFEGVHLRGGKVARGGLRWSDRPEDFRTEVLGLVKAQMVKNIGDRAGGIEGRLRAEARTCGFRPRRVHEGGHRLLPGLPARPARPHRQPRGRDRIVPPPDVKRHDPDDPYLVVAADKGTATFSDYANGISKEYGFWLGDAFASGGSVGYDHKAMGITARGAWESVKRHFREMGVDTQTTDFTVAGIGDMSGDVFGNGMLLSRHIRLVAAFDHRHIVLDPNPDPETSFSERERLFKLPRSTWADYDAKLISKGGGIHSRSAKSIAITPEVKAALAISADAHDADRTRQRDPQGAGRPDLQRRHRHLCEGHRRNACAGRRPRQRCAARERQRIALQGLRRRRQPGLHAAGARRVRRWPAGASTPTRSTTPPAWTRPITK